MVEIVMSSEKGSVADIISIETMALLLFITFKRLKLTLETSCFFVEGKHKMAVQSGCESIGVPK